MTKYERRQAQLEKEAAILGAAIDANEHLFDNDPLMGPTEPEWKPRLLDGDQPRLRFSEEGM